MAEPNILIQLLLARNVLRPLLSRGTHSQIRKVTLFCIYDLSNLSSRRKDAEDVSERSG